MPRLQFKLDRSLDAVYRVEELLGEIHEHEPPAGDDETDAIEPDDTAGEADQ
jgi:hypothetical protein